MEYNIPVKEGGLYKAILWVMDPFLELTHAERHVLAEILKMNIQVLNSTTRQSLKDSIGFNKYSLNNHIKALKDKGILRNNGTRDLEVNPNILNMVKDDTLTLRFYTDNTK